MLASGTSDRRMPRVKSGPLSTACSSLTSSTPFEGSIGGRAPNHSARSPDDQFALHGRVQRTGVLVLALAVGDIAAALPLEERARVPPGFPRDGRCVRNDVPVD